jgi:saccharopine dehydrogenase-like NADP-dependent oxidoreductase
MHTVLVLGGYGFFGKRISRGLSRNSAIRVLIGGRDRSKAVAAVDDLGIPRENAVEIDATNVRLAEILASLRVDTLIHTAGPFQGQDYAVARAAIQAHCNYVDLADGRSFVSHIESLDRAARHVDISIVSGASSVPALSSAVVDRYLPRFGKLESIRMGIGSGAKAPGLATMKGVFSYCGRPFLQWKDGDWVSVHGWLGTIRHRFPDPVGARLLGCCDVPDLDLFPKRYPSVTTVTFHAGFAGNSGHLAVWLGATLVKAGMLKSMMPLAAPLHRVSGWTEAFVSDKGAMFVELDGIDPDGRPLTKAWTLLALKNHGPYIPCGASIALAHKFAAGDSLPRGAFPCMGLLTVSEYLSALRDLDIYEITPQD